MQWTGTRRAKYSTLCSRWVSHYSSAPIPSEMVLTWRLKTSLLCADAMTFKMCLTISRDVDPLRWYWLVPDQVYDCQNGQKAKILPAFPIQTAILGSSLRRARASSSSCRASFIVLHVSNISMSQIWVNVPCAVLSLTSLLTAGRRYHRPRL